MSSTADYSGIAVVILNFNGAQFLRQFLPSVLAHSHNARIVVADNASTDGSLSVLKQEFPEVEVIRLTRNYGFCGGYNRALRHITADYFVLLNSDIEVTANWLSPLFELMQVRGDLAAVQPKIKAFAAKEQFEYAGAAGGYIDKFGYPFCRGRIFDSIETDTGQYNDIQEVFWATGACLMIRAELYGQMGGLDELFFAHMEEIDLCWRLQNQGWKIAYCGKSTVYHVGGGTLPVTSPRKTYFNFRNNLYLLYKNLPPLVKWKTLFIRMALDGVAGLKFLSEGKFNHFFAVLKAHFTFYKTMPQLKKAGTYRNLEELPVYHFSIVKAHFLDGKKKVNELKGFQKVRTS